MPGALLFDLDGTLVDTAPDFTRILNAMRSALQLPELDISVVRRWVSQGARHVIVRGFADYSLDPAQLETLRLEFLSRYEQLTCYESRLFTGMPALITELEAHGHAWGIVTNKPERYTTPLLQALDLHPGAVICPDHVQQSKPDPEGLLLACRQLGCSAPSSLYVGDHERDIEAGRRAGMRTIAVTWGYILEGDDPHNWHADFLMTQPQQLSSLLHLI